MSALSIQYINPFLAAAKNVCGTSMNLEVIAGKARLAETGERIWKSYQISALIELSNAVSGCVVVSFSERAAIMLASTLAGSEFTSIDSDCRDALGEIANLIVGSAKRDLPTGLICMSIPKIVDTQSVILPHQPPALLVPFETSIGRFLVQLAIKQMKAPPAS